MIVNDNINTKHKLQAYLSNSDNLHYGTAVIDSDLSATVLEANPAFFNIIGHTEEQFKQNHNNSLISILIDDVYSKIEEMLRAGKDGDIEWDLRIKTANDNIVWVRDMVHYDATSDLFYITIVNITDITPQKQIERQLEEKSALHNCIESLFVVGAEDRNCQEAYKDILTQLRAFYQADRAFFYKFKTGTYEVNFFLENTEDGLKKIELSLPLTVTAEQVAEMQALTNMDLTNIDIVLKSFKKSYREHLIEAYKVYKIKTFSCIAVNDEHGNITAFLGVTNPKANKHEKELMHVLSRFIFLFVQHHEADINRVESLKMETISKEKIVALAAKKFHDMTSVKENIEEVLDALCDHFDADFATVLATNEDGTCGPKYMGGSSIPDLSRFCNQPITLVDQWVNVFSNGQKVLSNTDFIDFEEGKFKKNISKNLGINNFIFSLIKNSKGEKVGVLFVNNINHLERSRLLLHGVASGISDYLERVKLSQKNQLEPATKLANKIATQKQIDIYLSKEKTGTLFIVDIDNFKNLNDTLGHSVGDQVILDVADILRQTFRSTDVIGRIGGDEFMAFSPNSMSEELINKKVNIVLENCNKTYQKDGRPVEISVSIGVCSVNPTCESFQSLYEKADLALYKSKRAGKNQYNIHAN